MLISASLGPPQYKADASAQAGKRCPHQLGYLSILPAVPQGPLSRCPRRNDRPLSPTHSAPSMSPTARETRVDRSEPPSRSPRARARPPRTSVRLKGPGPSQQLRRATLEPSHRLARGAIRSPRSACDGSSHRAVGPPHASSLQASGGVQSWWPSCPSGHRRPVVEDGDVAGEVRLGEAVLCRDRRRGVASDARRSVLKRRWTTYPSLVY